MFMLALPLCTVSIFERERERPIAVVPWGGAVVTVGWVQGITQQFVCTVSTDNCMQQVQAKSWKTFKWHF